MSEIISDRLYGKREIWILGDFYVDLLKRDDTNVIKLQNFTKKAGLTQQILEITRPNRKGGSCIDLMMTDSPFVKMSGTMNDYVSDHYTIFSIRKKACENKEYQVKTIRSFKNFNKEDFETLLLNKNWAIYDMLVEPNQQWLYIYKCTIDILSVMCPFKTINVRKQSTPWITPEIFDMIKEKRNLVKLYKEFREPIILKELRILRNNLNSTIDKAKCIYIEEILETH